MSNSPSWLLRTPQELINDYYQAEGVWRAGISVSVHIIDSKKLFILSKGLQYCVPEYSFTPSAVRPESMEFYAFQFLQPYIAAKRLRLAFQFLQPYIAAKRLRQVRFVDFAFDAPLIAKQRGPDDKTMRISLVVMAMDGKTLTNAIVQEITGGKFEGCDFFSFEEIEGFLHPDRVHENLRATWRYKNFVPRLKNVHQAGVEETSVFRSFCSKSICGEILHVELRHRRSLERGYVCLRQERDGSLYLFPFVYNNMPSEDKKKRVIMFGGVAYEVLGKWIKLRDFFGPIEMRTGADTPQLWWEVFDGEGSMAIELVDVGDDDIALWTSPVWRDTVGAADSVPAWIDRHQGQWVLQDCI